MLELGENRARSKVNILNKVKVDGQWKLCPAIVEPGGKLKDRVQIMENGYDFWLERHSSTSYP